MFTLLEKNLCATMPKSTQAAKLIAMLAILSSLTEYSRRKLRLLAMSDVGQIAVPLLMMMLIGTFGYSAIEGWSLIDALYATVITMTTVGYGDVTPNTVAGRVFSIVFTLSAIGIASYAISTLAGAVISKQARRVERRVREQRMQKIADLTGHVIICGGSIMGHRAANEFRQRGQSFVLIESDEERLHSALLWMNPDYINKRQRQFSHMEHVDLDEHEQKSIGELAQEINILYLLADPTNERALLQAGIARAKGILTAMPDDRDNVSIILSARDMQGKLNNHDLRIVSGVSSEQSIRRIYLAGANKVTAPNLVGSLQMVDHMLSPQVGEMWDQMLYSQEEMFRFTEWHVDQHPEWIGRTVEDLRRERGQQAIAIHRNNTYLYTPAPDTMLAHGDVIIVVGRHQ